MKRFIGIYIVILFAFIFAKGMFAQPVQGKKFEFSTSASMWNVKEKGGETETFINLPIRIGYFIFMAMHLTQVTPICSIYGYGRLPASYYGICETV